MVTNNLSSMTMDDVNCILLDQVHEFGRMESEEVRVALAFFELGDYRTSTRSAGGKLRNPNSERYIDLSLGSTTGSLFAVRPSALHLSDLAIDYPA